MRKKVSPELKQGPERKEEKGACNHLPAPSGTGWVPESHRLSPGLILKYGSGTVIQPDLMNKTKPKPDPER